MADLSFALVNGVGTDNPTKMNNVTIGTASPTSGQDFEFRIHAVDANSNVITRLEMLKALEAFELVISSMGQYTTAQNG